MTVPMTYALSMERLVEQARAMAALHILARGGDSPLRELTCEGRRELLESTLRDAFVECVMESPVPTVDVDIREPTLTLLTPETTARGPSLAVERTLTQMIAARALELWASMAALTSEASRFAEMATAARHRLRTLLTPPSTFIRPAYP